MKKLLILILLASTLTASAYEFKVGDVIAWTRDNKHHEGRITARVKRNGHALVLHVYEFGAWKVVEVKAGDRPILIATTN